jgi:hypothetical protein
MPVTGEGREIKSRVNPREAELIFESKKQERLVSFLAAQLRSFVSSLLMLEAPASTLQSVPRPSGND